MGEKMTSAEEQSLEALFAGAAPLPPGGLPFTEMSDVAVTIDGLDCVRHLKIRDASAVLTIAEDSVVNCKSGAIVNAANEGCLGGGGIDGVIGRLGGETLAAARKELPIITHGPSGKVRCRTGDAKLTIAGELPCEFVIHAVGPDFDEYRDQNEAMSLLVNAYKSSMERACEQGVKKVAFCMLSAGIFRGSCPLNDIVEVGLRTIAQHVYPGLERVYLCAYSDEEKEQLRVICSAIRQARRSAHETEAAEAARADQDAAAAGVAEAAAARAEERSADRNPRDDDGEEGEKKEKREFERFAEDVYDGLVRNQKRVPPSLKKGLTKTFVSHQLCKATLEPRPDALSHLRACMVGRHAEVVIEVVVEHIHSTLDLVTQEATDATMVRFLHEVDATRWESITDDPFDLRGRFCEPYRRDFQAALREIRAGRKRGCWSWYFFPTAPWVVNGVERGSDTNREYALRDMPPDGHSGDEAARAFLRFKADAVDLRGSYLAIVAAVAEQLEDGVEVMRLVGEDDEPKLKSSLQLFERVTRGGEDPEVHEACRCALRAGWGEGSPDGEDEPGSPSLEELIARC